MREGTAIVLAPAPQPHVHSRAEACAQPQGLVIAGCRSDAFKDREEWQLACRVIASKGFRKSELLQRFLLEICELMLTGREQEITEQNMGVRIFARSEGYDTGEDNIVRSYARMLRKRLEAYFADEGAHEFLQLSVPRGGYIPVFSLAPGARKPVTSAPSTAIDIPSQIAQEDSADNLAKTQKMTARWKLAACSALAGVLVTLLVFVVVHAVQMHRNASAAHVLWMQVFEKNRATLIVPADSGLGIVENLTRTQPTVDSYASGTYFAESEAPPSLDAGNFNDLTRQHYTSTVDLAICTALARLPEFIGDRTQTRFARSLTVEEIRNTNVILLGSSHTNPWVALFEPQLNFQLKYTAEVDHSYIVNRHPQAGESAKYANGAADGHAPTYGTVAYLPDAGGAAHVLILEGLSMAGTQAAANILFSATAMQPVLRAAAAPGGRLHAFELLVETTSVDASASTARIVATRVYPET